MGNSGSRGGGGGGSGSSRGDVCRVDKSHDPSRPCPSGGEGRYSSHEVSYGGRIYSDKGRGDGCYDRTDKNYSMDSSYSSAHSNSRGGEGRAGGSGSNGIHRESRSSENTVHKSKQHIDKSVALRQSGDYETALKSCDGALQANPKYLDGWNEKASVLMSKGQYEKAIECCDTAIKIDSTYFVAYNNKALSLTKLGKYDKAIECCNLAIQYMGVHNIAVKIEESNSLYLERLELYKNSAAKRDYLYNSSNVNGVNAFSWSIQNPTHGFAWFFEYSLKVSSTTPDNVRIIKNLNKNLPVYIEEVKRADYFWDQYNKYYQDMVSLKEKLTLVSCVYNIKAEALKKSGDYESALKYCDLALKINPTYVTVVNFKDYILREKADFEKAVECSENMLRIKPSYQMSNFDYFLKLPCLSTVSTINLSNNQISDSGAKVLADSLAKGKMPNLKKLQLEGNNITDEGYGFLIDSLKSIEQSISIVFRKVSGFSKEALKGIMDGMLSIAQKNGISTKEVLTTDETIEHCKKGTYNVIQNIAVGATTCTTPIGTVVDIYELNISSLFLDAVGVVYPPAKAVNMFFCMTEETAYSIVDEDFANCLVGVTKSLEE